MVRGNPRLYGGLVVHIGVVVIAVALAASSGYVTRREVQLDKGEIGDGARLHGHLSRFAGRPQRAEDQRQGRVRLERGGDDLGVYAPAISTFPNFNSGIGTPSVRTGILQDVYLTLVSSPTETGAVTLARADQPDGRLALDRWRDHGARYRARLVARPPASHRRSRPRAAPGRTRAEARQSPADGGGRRARRPSGEP